MLIKIVILIIYALFVFFLELLVEKRLYLITERHNQKIGGGYAAVGLSSLHKRLLIILRVIASLLFITGASISLLLL